MLTKIKSTRVTDVFIAEEPIGSLVVVCISTSGGRKVKVGSDTTQELVVGVAMGSILSGQIARVVTHGEVSDVLCATAITAGDRLTCASGGYVTPLNTITPAGIISRVSGLISPVTGTISQVSGLISPVTGTISQVSGLISLVSGAISQVSGFINLVSGVGAAGIVGVDGTSLSNISGAPIANLAGFVGAIPQFIGVAPIFSGAVPTFAGAAPIFSGAIPIFTGVAPVFSGAVPTLTGTAFNTQRVLGKALDNALGLGSGIRVFVTIGG